MRMAWLVVKAAGAERTGHDGHDGMMASLTTESWGDWGGFGGRTIKETRTGSL